MLPPAMRQLRIPCAVFDGMIAHARADAPLECCGLLAGVVSEDGAGWVRQRYALINEAASPFEYLSEPQSMFVAWRDMHRQHLDVLAVYHSHPTSPPVPSKKDLAQNYGPGVINFIISLLTEPPTTRGWWLDTESFTEASWEVTPHEDHDESGLAGNPPNSDQHS